MKLRLFCVVITLSVILSYSVSASGIGRQDSMTVMSEFSTSAEAVMLYCCDNSETVYSSNADKQMPMASTTKIMTAIVAIENSDVTRVVSVAPKACGVEGSSIYLYENERITVEDLLYALMLESANDAACALAIAVGGDLDSFVGMMNDKAKELGLDNTHYSNPHGLDEEGHYSTARDLAILMTYAMKNEVFSHITATYRHSSVMSGTDTTRVFINHNRLLNSCEGVCGGKTGYTKRSGRCLVSVAVRDGIMMCAVTLNDPNDWNDHALLYDSGFGIYERVEFDAVIFDIPVINSKKKSIRAETDFHSFVVKKEDADRIETVYEHDRFCYAGVDKGEVLGRVVYMVGTAEISSADISASEDARSIEYKKNFFEKLISFFIRD